MVSVIAIFQQSGVTLLLSRRLLLREQFKKEGGMTSPSLSKPETAKVGSFLRFLRRVVAHWRAIVLLLILACVAFLVARSEEFGRFELMLLALLLIFIAGQIF